MNFFSLFKRQIIYNLKKKISIDTDELTGKTLDQLFHHYGSDKANIFSKNNEEGHGYSTYYSNKLHSFKNKKINILEIGSYAGASAAAFVKYFPSSNVFCFDINISNFKYSSKNIHVHGIDINNKIKVKKTLNNIFTLNKINHFDIIIDDGSHNLSDILVSLNFFFKYLKSSGMFIIEDFKYPNYHKYNRDIAHILIEDTLTHIKNKNYFKSSIFSKNDQSYLMNSIDKIDIFKGNLADSDICFIKKN